MRKNNKGIRIAGGKFGVDNYKEKLSVYQTTDERIGVRKVETPLCGEPLECNSTKRRN